MEKSTVKSAIKAWGNGSFFFEEYHFTSGAHQPLEAHLHPEYQIGLAVDTCGRYEYRGSRLTAPRMTLSVIHSGAVHKPSKGELVENSCRYQMLYVAPEVLMETAREIGWRKNLELPCFSDFVIDDSRLVKEYLNLFNCADSVKSRLTVDVYQTDFLTTLVKYFSQVKNSAKKLKSAQPAIKKAREYLDANFTAQISLEKLARIAQISKYHLCRQFREVVGVSPHIYQNHLRLNLAKKNARAERTACRCRLRTRFL